jgi:predicted amidophosphoribosyltransferase
MGALRVFCPNCWIEINAEDNICEGCGFRLATFDSLSYEAKLLLALKVNDVAM